MENILTVNVEDTIVLIGGLFAAYYLMLEIMNWFSTITNSFSPNKEIIMAGAMPATSPEGIKVEEIIINDHFKKDMEQINELKEETISQVAVKYPLGQNTQGFNEFNKEAFTKSETPDLSNIRLPGVGLTTNPDKIINL